jgi:hypothetical protein
VGTPQYDFIEHCLSTVDRKHQPWLIFATHRVLGYSSNAWYAGEGSFEEPEGRENLQKLWRDHLRGGRWRRLPPVGLHDGDPQVELLQCHR